MKFLVLFACVAVASAQLVTYPNGAVAPAKTPEVLAAEHAHFAAKGLPLAGYYGGLYGVPTMVCGTDMLVPTTDGLDMDMLDTQDTPEHTLDGDTHMPQHSLDTPTVPSSQLNPLMSSLPVPTTWLPML